MTKHFENSDRHGHLTRIFIGKCVSLNFSPTMQAFKNFILDLIAVINEWFVSNKEIQVAGESIILKKYRNGVK